MPGSVFRWMLINLSSHLSLLGTLNNRSVMKGSKDCALLVGA